MHLLIHYEISKSEHELYALSAGIMNAFMEALLFPFSHKFYVVNAKGNAKLNRLPLLRARKTDTVTNKMERLIHSY